MTTEPSYSTLDPERIKKVRDGDAGATVVLYFDIPAGVGSQVIAMTRSFSAGIYAMLQSALEDGQAVELTDDAADAIRGGLDAPVDVHAALKPILQALSEVTLKGTFKGFPV